ncbi:MAG TPA: serine/threonine-protein kinase [Byssovorax sp.]
MLQPGARIGGYLVGSRLGAGGMGEVWLAEHVALGRRAALKVLHGEMSARPDVVARFFNEARAAAAIADPGIVQIFDFGHAADGSAYIVMELLDGEPLDRRLARLGRVALADALRVMRQVATSLGAAHARGIIHRDLKPENIFLVPDAEVAGGERPKLLDFGIAKLTGMTGDARTKTASILGTPAYMSPEQCRGAGAIDTRSDVYALGCVLFALITGRPPFEAEGMGEVLAKHMYEPPPRASDLVPGIPSAVDDLLARCLAKEPAGRFAAAGELALARARIHPTGAPLVPAPLAPTLVPATTTLSAATGVRSEPASSRGWLALAAVVVVAGGLAIGVAASRAPEHVELPARVDAPVRVEASPARVETPAPLEMPRVHLAASTTARAALAALRRWGHRDRAALPSATPSPTPTPTPSPCGDDIPSCK